MLRKIIDEIKGIPNSTYQYVTNTNRISDQELERIYNEIPPYERIFSSIVGFTDIKKLLYRAIQSKFNVSYCLIGPPASAKSVFLNEIERHFPDESTYVDGSGSSGRGLVELLIEKPDTKYLLIDEIDKMTKKDVTVLYNLLETGRLQQNKRAFVIDQMYEGLRVFAASNSKDRMPEPLLSRITSIIIPEYTYTQFQEISRRPMGPKIVSITIHIRPGPLRILDGGFRFRTCLS